MNKDYIVLYSTNTYLAYHINEIYYDSKHFVWCSPVFNPNVLSEEDPRRRIPPSSSPYNIYKTLKEDVEKADLHSAKIRDNKEGLMKGAGIMYRNEIIDLKTKATIEKIIKTATINDFIPLLYVIPYQLVANKINTVEVSDRANPLSEEYQIIDLLKGEFDIIKF